MGCTQTPSRWREYGAGCWLKQPGGLLTGFCKPVCPSRFLLVLGLLLCIPCFSALIKKERLSSCTQPEWGDLG